jgi:hypothetical protein
MRTTSLGLPPYSVEYFPSIKLFLGSLLRVDKLFQPMYQAFGGFKDK